MAPDGDSPERGSYLQVVLVERLRSAIVWLNPAIPLVAREDALQQVLNLEVPGLLAANRRFHQLLVNGVPVQYPRGSQSRRSLGFEPR